MELEKLPTQVVLSKVDANLRQVEGYNGYTIQANNITFLGIEEAVGLEVLDNELLHEEKYILEEQKQSALTQLEAIITQFPLDVFQVSPEKLAIYQRKQLLWNTWSQESIPQKPQTEWDLDWSQRPSFITNGFVLVSALNRQFKCFTAEHLWQTWGLNTALANDLDEQSEPLRTMTQYLIEEASDVESVLAAVSNFYLGLNKIITTFMTNKAQDLIDASGLEEVGS